MTQIGARISLPIVATRCLTTYDVAPSARNRESSGWAKSFETKNRIPVSAGTRGKA